MAVSQRVTVSPGILEWARERAKMEIEELLSKQDFQYLREWENGTRHPTLTQLEKYAKATCTPIGFFFLSEPLDEPVPLPDFRTHTDPTMERPSAYLLDTVYLCQQRQAWYREYAQANREEPVAFVGTCSTATVTATVEAVEILRKTLGIRFPDRDTSPIPARALPQLASSAEDAGVLVMRNKYVRNSTQNLDPKEFRGFTLADPYAPLVFVNSADTKTVQLFTLAQELTHLLLGQTALNTPSLREKPPNETEHWCTDVAIEFLLPRHAFEEAIDPMTDLETEINRLARELGTSTLLILRRMHDLGKIDRENFHATYTSEDEKARTIETNQIRGSRFGE